MTNRISQYHKNTTAVSGSYADKLVVVDGNRANWELKAVISVSPPALFRGQPWQNLRVDGAA